MGWSARNVIVIDLVGVIERPGPIDVGVDAIADLELVEPLREQEVEPVPGIVVAIFLNWRFEYNWLLPVAPNLSRLVATTQTCPVAKPAANTAECPVQKAADRDHAEVLDLEIDLARWTTDLSLGRTRGIAITCGYDRSGIRNSEITRTTSTTRKTIALVLERFRKL